MSDSCPNLKTCAFFNTFYAHSAVVKEGWIKLYCENKAKSDHCMRKQVMAAGKTPADNLAPTGKLLQKVKVPEGSE